MMGRVVSVNVEMGQSIAAGDVLAIMESLKMELYYSFAHGRMYHPH